MSQHNKKAALELSIGTVVIIVLAMSMLILGLVLIGNIFEGADESVNVLNDKVLNAMSSLFTDEGEDVIVKLGPDQTAKLKPEEIAVPLIDRANFRVPGAQETTPRNVMILDSGDTYDEATQLCIVSEEDE